MDKAFHQDWRQLEILAYQYVNSKYNTGEIADEQLTRSSHDSGFDGTWLLHPEHASALAQRVLMEAKLRNTQSSLSLNDCAKSIIIAFNLAAKKLYIVTNIGFAPQTQTHVKKFQKRSNLLIDCVDGMELKRYIELNWEYLTQTCKLTNEFLDSIIEFANHLPTHKSAEDNPTEKDISEQMYWLDYKRKDAIFQIVQYLYSKKGICLITGNAGVGKSIIKMLTNQQLAHKDFDICEIDLQLCTSVRILYLNILEAIWGIDISLILKDCELKNYIDQLLKTSGGIIDSNIADAITHILLVSVNQYEKHKDIYLHLLLKYINMVLCDKDNLKMVISFENLNMASGEIISFLLESIKVLRKNNIKIVLEARTPFLINNTVDYTSSQFYFSQINQCADLLINLTAFERNDSIKLIQKSFPALKETVSNSFANILADNPLEIMSSVSLLKTLPSFDCNLLNRASPIALEAYWEESGISRNTVIICLIKRMRESLCMSEIFELSILFKGHIPLKILEKLYAERAESVISEALDSTIFSEKDLVLVCNHLRFIDAMKLSSNENIALKLAYQLIGFFEAQEIDQNKFFMLELSLLYTVKNYECIPQKAFEIATQLRHNFQFQDALSVLLECLKIYKNPSCLQLKNSSLYITVLICALICIRELHEENNEVHIELYHLLECALILSNEKDREYKLEYELILWNKLFTNGQFQEALVVSGKLYRNWLQKTDFFEKENDYPGQIYRAYGLTIKMTEGADAAEQIFKEGVDRYPESFYAKASLLSHLGNSQLKQEPLEAAKTYTEILSVVASKNFSFQEDLHTKIDVAMSYFLAQSYEISKKFAEDGIEIASSIGIYMQKGRALNILGCCQAANGNYEEAAVAFEEAIQCLIQSKATIYLWRAQTNLATMLLMNQTTISEACELLRKVLSILTEGFKDKIEKDIKSVPYQAMLLILMYFTKMGYESQIDEILRFFKGTYLLDDYSKMKGLPNWETSFNNKVKYSGSVVLVTG